MADPVSMAAIGLTVAGSATKAFGALQEGEAQSGAYQYQASVARINQMISKQDASYAKSVGEVKAQEQGMKTAAVIGATRAAQGASGLDVNAGSAVEVRASEAAIGAYEQDVIRASAAKKAYGFEVEAMKSDYQAQTYSTAARNARTGSMINAISSLLGGASSVSSKWLQGSSLGMTEVGSEKS